MPLSEKAREIAERPAYPAPVYDDEVYLRPAACDGMTIHQALVREILSGSIAASVDGTHGGDSLAKRLAQIAVQRADAVCE